METTHKLEFEQREWFRNPEWWDFRVGTCNGIYRHNIDKESIEILAVVNEQKGNGHFKDVIEWFEFACRKQNLKLRFLETWNLRLAWNLRKHGYKMVGFMNWEKQF